MAEPTPELSVVVPMFDEEAVLPLFVERLRPVAETWGVPYEILCVDDGSRDATPVLLQRLRREWPEVRVLRLRANAGHQAAISAGLSRARGRWVVTIDADLQDPPEVIGTMLRVAREEGVDVVYGVREDRSSDSVFKRVTARAFYRSIRALSDVDAHVDAGDFRLMSRATVEAVCALPEQGRVLRLVVPALGFPSASVGYRRERRAAGESKYPLARMLRLSLDGVTGFSIVPLRLATWLGLLGGLGALAVLVYAVVAMLLGDTLPGWTSTVVIVAGVGAVQLLALGILGEYVGRTYTALQARPSYFVAHDSLEEVRAPVRPHVVPVRDDVRDEPADDVEPGGPGEDAGHPPPRRAAGGQTRT
ncbi:glycosyltransferase family 2 protein [Phycicoccus endophyticus]|uniref:Glycosyltransferase family 2 protein n=1 Tax=Phycicoccus endophyticus TaxID=1690220 RepID=A0A7G9R5B4_9MICO|nr:glycosyltransferase family 2 protein [Phycicoccus endophyticus]NHI20956.1 glycosyltransferase family 2 protein [Phycicoccus endophyticus]QNN50789.1 glycosyltransferase family 2 protein [Phycicoccus endophyticus]GGL40317.1 glucosyl transferase [Phycicoccus endophyticus]